MTKAFLPQEDKNIYSEGIDYTLTGDKSIWGTEDRLTVDALKRDDIRGRWLNLCAGDGRFNDLLLQKTDQVVASDIDPGALEKLQRITPQDLKSKLTLQICNVTEPLPFADAFFDGIFCTGTLHLFPRPVFMKIGDELDRILKPGGVMVLDFATDIRRVRPDGSLYTVQGEPLYTQAEALDFLKECFADFQTEFQTASVEPEEVHVRGESYMFSSNFILLVAKKQLAV